jgi:hypothetical protein
MIARAQYEHTLQKEGHENTADEAELQVYDSESSSNSSTSNAPDLSEKTDVDAENKPEPYTSSKRRRPPIDHFAGMLISSVQSLNLLILALGYGEDTDGPAEARALRKLKKSTDTDPVLVTTGNRKVKKSKKGKKPQ